MPLQDQLIALLRSGAPDFAAADMLLARGADPNASGKDEDGNVLSEILIGCWRSEKGDDLSGECDNCKKAGCSGCEQNRNPDLGESWYAS